MPLVADIPQALPIEVLQVSQTQAASELGGTERVGRDGIVLVRLAMARLQTGYQVVGNVTCAAF